MLISELPDAAERSFQAPPGILPQRNKSSSFHIETTDAISIFK
jgi:hypothetical protein